jgi:hypothetical protein
VLALDLWRAVPPGRGYSKAGLGNSERPRDAACGGDVGKAAPSAAKIAVIANVAMNQGAQML